MSDEEKQDGEQEAQPEPKPAKKPAPDPMIPVRVVARKGESALVEWIDGDGLYRRAYVPAGKVQEGAAPSKVLDQAIPYGLPWEQWIEVTATPEGIANELRRQGMWRWEDFNKAALSAANKAFDLGAFIRRVSQEVR